MLDGQLRGVGVRGPLVSASWGVVAVIGMFSR